MCRLGKAVSCANIANLLHYGLHWWSKPSVATISMSYNGGDLLCCQQWYFRVQGWFSLIGCCCVLVFEQWTQLVSLCDIKWERAIPLSLFQLTLPWINSLSLLLSLSYCLSVLLLSVCSLGLPSPCLFVSPLSFSSQWDICSSVLLVLFVSQSVAGTCFSLCSVGIWRRLPRCECVCVHWACSTGR
jgi:hypothetical protein